MDNPRLLQYLDADCTLTLREGIQALRQLEGIEGDAAAHVAPELARDLEIHDAIHVLFACSTPLISEVTAHVWTLLGTTTKLSDMHRVTSHQDHQAVLKQIGNWRLLAGWLRSLPKIVLTLFNASTMTQRWPVEELDQFLDQPLNEIRQEFGIRLVSLSRPSTNFQQHGAALRHLRV